MNKILCSIEHVTDDNLNSYRVRYLKNHSYYIELCESLYEAIQFAERHLHAMRDEILLSINK